MRWLEKEKLAANFEIKDLVSLKIEILSWYGGCLIKEVNRRETACRILRYLKANPVKSIYFKTSERNVSIFTTADWT